RREAADAYRQPRLRSGAYRRIVRRTRASETVNCGQSANRRDLRARRRDCRRTLPSARDISVSFHSRAASRACRANVREGIMSEVGTLESSPWYRSLSGAQWKALVASNLGWTFDGFEVFALILPVGVALHQLLAPSQYPFTPAYAGAIIAITVFGW